MPGLDSYTKLLLHCNGIDGSTNFPDSSGSGHVVTANADAQIDTSLSKFGGASGLFDGVGDFLSIPNSSDWDFGTGDFTIDFWVYRNGNQADFAGLIGSLPSSGLVGYELGFGSDTYYGNSNKVRLTTSASGYWAEDLVDTDILPNTTWCHVALVRNGNLLSLYVNGISKASVNVTGYNYNSAGIGMTIGKARNGYDGLYISSSIDELRVSKGIARWTSNFTPSTEEYSSNYTEIIFESINLTDSLNAEQDPPTELLSLSESWIVSVLGTIYTKFQTKLYTSLQNNKFYLTDLRTVFNTVKKYSTKLYTLVFINKIYNTDLRVRINSIDEIVPKSLDDILVKLDGTTLVDVDYTSLVINLNLNITPSNTQFILARRHDNLDKTLDNVTSTITNENKVEVFDGSRKCFTGYISQIDADSSRDVVKITAADCRLKMSRQSMKLEYGGEWKIDANQNGIVDDDEVTNDIAWGSPNYIKFEKNIGQAFIEVMTAVGSLVSGYETLSFPGSFVPEYVKTEKDYTSLIDELIRQTANCNWYIDENERLCFQKIGSGVIKSLPLSSLNSKRHIYDLIIDNVQLNRPSSNYAQSLIIKRGTNIIEEYKTRMFRNFLADEYRTFITSLKEKTAFVFHQFGDGPFIISDPDGGGSGPYYTGMNGLAISYYRKWDGGWLSYPTVIVQWLNKKSSLNLSDITVGSGLPTKTIYLNSYGKKVSNEHYGEEIKVGQNPNSTINTGISDRAYLVKITDENYNNTEFLLDIANFELSQNNKLNTTATLSLILDAYEYYNLSFKDLINLSNTIQSGIYTNNNGFPLNIESIQINCATRTVNLNLTNHGKTYYAKSANKLKFYTKPTVEYLARKWIWRVITTDGTVYTTG